MDDNYTDCVNCWSVWFKVEVIFVCCCVGLLLFVLCVKEESGECIGVFLLFLFFLYLLAPF